MEIGPYGFGRITALSAKQWVARFPTLEQAEWRAKELNEHSERNPRGYVQYLVQPVEERPKEG